MVSETRKFPAKYLALALIFPEMNNYSPLDISKPSHLPWAYIQIIPSTLKTHPEQTLGEPLTETSHPGQAHS